MSRHITSKGIRTAMAGAVALALLSVTAVAGAQATGRTGVPAAAPDSLMAWPWPPWWMSKWVGFALQAVVYHILHKVAALLGFLEVRVLERTTRHLFAERK